jgi:hypothetical protein
MYSDESYLLHAGFFLGLLSNLEDGDYTFLRNTLNYTGLHGLIFQNKELLVTIALRTSDPTYLKVTEHGRRNKKIA